MDNKLNITKEEMNNIKVDMLISMCLFLFGHFFEENSIKKMFETIKKSLYNFHDKKVVDMVIGPAEDGAIALSKTSKH